MLVSGESNGMWTLRVLGVAVALGTSALAVEPSSELVIQNAHGVSNAAAFSPDGRLIASVGEKDAQDLGPRGQALAHGGRARGRSHQRDLQP